jgi:hypothetical protein
MLVCMNEKLIIQFLIISSESVGYLVIIPLLTKSH